jgi:hypothetical protein
MRMMRCCLAHRGCLPVVGAPQSPIKIGLRGPVSILGTRRRPALWSCGAGGGRGARVLSESSGPSERGARPLLAAAARLFCWPPGADRPEWRALVLGPTVRLAPALDLCAVHVSRIAEPGSQSRGPSNHDEVASRGLAAVAETQDTLDWSTDWLIG